MIVVLHLAAALKETHNDAANPSGAPHALSDDHILWVFAARIADLEKDRGVSVLLPDSKRAPCSGTVTRLRRFRTPANPRMNRFPRGG